MPFTAACGAPQPADDALRIGNFNFAIPEHYLEPQNKIRQKAVSENFERIIHKSAEEGCLDLFFGSGIGKESARLNVACMGCMHYNKGFNYGLDTNCVYAYGFRERLKVQFLANHPAVLSPRSVAIRGFVIKVFHVSTSDTTFGNLVVGNLNLRQEASQGIIHRRKKVQSALHSLEEIGNSCVLQPAVKILLGDTNLSVEIAEEALLPLQPSEDHAEWWNTWHIHTSTTAGSGDLLFCKGAHAESFDIPIGANYKDKGIREDVHDAFGVAVTLPVSCQDSRVPQPDSLYETPEDIYNNMLEFFEDRDLHGSVGKRIAQHLRNILFKNILRDVPVECCSTGAFQPREHPTVTTFVKAGDMLERIRSTIAIRQKWLSDKGLPRNLQMTSAQQKAFVTDVRNEFELQNDLNRRPYPKRRKMSCPNVVWQHEMQRRCGSEELWRVLSFIGCFAPNHQALALCYKDSRELLSRASQPAVVKRKQQLQDITEARRKTGNQFSSCETAFVRL